MLIRTLSRPFFYDWTALFIFAGVDHLYTMNEELKQLLEWFDNYNITFNEIRYWRRKRKKIRNDNHCIEDIP